MKIFIGLNLVFLYYFVKSQKFSRSYLTMVDKDPEYPHILMKGDYPFYVLLEACNSAVTCGGALITEKHVITAAHCVFQQQCIYGSFGLVQLGKAEIQNKTNLMNFPDEVIKWEIDGIKFHEDIAILTFNINFDELNNEFIKPIELDYVDRNNIFDLQLLGFLGFNLEPENHLKHGLGRPRREIDTELWQDYQFVVDYHNNDRFRIISSKDFGGPIFYKANTNSTPKLIGVLTKEAQGGLAVVAINCFKEFITKNVIF